MRKLTIILFSIMWEYYYPQTDSFITLRNNMVKYQIADRGISNNQLLRAMRKVPRHLFVPAEYQNEAYADYPGIIPQPLIDQLAENGRLVIPVGEPFSVQELILIVKKNGKIEKRRLTTVKFVPFKRL